MKLNLKNLAYNVMMAVMFALVLMPFFGASAGATAGAALLGVGCLLPAAPAGVVPTAGLGLMAIQKEIWVEDIAENVFADNTFINQCRDDSAFLSGKVVHLPQAGNTPNTQKNRAVLPAAATKRADTETTYVVDELTTDPVVLTVTEEIEASYPKRQSILHDHIETLATGAADIAAYVWTPTVAENIIASTGALRPAYKPTQTGQRKAFTKADLLNASRILNRMNVPANGRVALIDSDVFMDLMLIPEFTQAYAIGQNTNITDGSIAKVLGFTFFLRSNTTIFSAAGVKKDPAAAAAATDNLSALFWHPNFVRFAKGTKDNGGVMVFEDPANPLYYGDVFSAMLRVGGKIARIDQKGVVAIYEGQ